MLLCVDVWLLCLLCFTVMWVAVMLRASFAFDCLHLVCCFCGVGVVLLLCVML